MNRIWLGRLLALSFMVAVYFAADRGYLGWPAILVFFAAAMIIFAVRKRRGDAVPPVPPYFRKLPLWRFILIGAGLILAAFAWLIFGFVFFNLQNVQNTYAIMLPFAVLLIAGLAMAGGASGLKLGILLWDRL